jgi:hypothetical protein
MSNGAPQPRVSLRFLVLAAVVVFVILALMFIGAATYASMNPNDAWAQRLLESLKIANREAWDFVRPLLQLIVGATVLIAVLSYLGVRVGADGFGVAGNVQALIALILVSALAVASLLVAGGLEALKDLSVVVVGFYFGSKKLREQGRANVALLPAPPPHVPPATPPAPPAVQAEAALDVTGTRQAGV